MPPKIKITRDDIVNTAVDIVRKCGVQSINARTIAAALNCSTQPIFSNFATMEELHQAVVDRSRQIYQDYIQREMEHSQLPSYKASGMAYIRFAKDEKELFKLLYMRNRTNSADHTDDEYFNSTVSFVQSYTGLSEAGARAFHLEIWAFVHGIATMFATNYLDLDWDLVSKMLSDAYFGLRKQYETEQ